MGRPAIVLQTGRIQQRVGIDLVAWAIQNTAAVIVAQIVAERSDCAAAIENGLRRTVALKNVVGELDPIAGRINNRADSVGSVLVERAISDCQRSAARRSVHINRRAISGAIVGVESAIGKAAGHGAHKTCVLNRTTAIRIGKVQVERGPTDGDGGAAAERAVIIDDTAVIIRTILEKGAVANDKYRVAIVTAIVNRAAVVAMTEDDARIGEGQLCIATRAIDVDRAAVHPETAVVHCQTGNNNIGEAIDIKNPEAWRASGTTTLKHRAIALKRYFMATISAKLRQAVNAIVTSRKRVSAVNRQSDRIVFAIGIGCVDGILES